MRSVRIGTEFGGCSNEPFKIRNQREKSLGHQSFAVLHLLNVDQMDVKNSSVQIYLTALRNEDNINWHFFSSFFGPSLGRNQILFGWSVCGYNDFTLIG